MARSAISPRCCRCFCPRAWPAKRFRSTSGCGSDCLPLPSLDEEERYRRLKRWVEELPADERLAFFKLITGELRVGVSRLQVVKALAEVAGVDEGRMAQRLIGYSQARRIAVGRGFRGADRRGRCTQRREALDAGRPYPFYLAQSWSRPLERCCRRWPALGLDRRMEVRRHPRAAPEARRQLAALVARRGADFRRLSRSRAAGACAALRASAIDGELVVLIPPEQGDSVADSLDGLALFASLQQRLGRKIVSEKTMRELPVAFIAYDLIEMRGPRHPRQAAARAPRPA